MDAGALTVVGTGILFPDHLTDAARNAVEAADVVVYVVDNPETEAWLKGTAREAVSLRACGQTSAESGGAETSGASRRSVYDAMVDRTLRFVRSGKHVCAVYYGHPGMFSYPGHEAVRQARAEGFRAEILPAVSTIDCLYADLQLDPAYNGLQVFDATDFLIHRRAISVTSDLILLQPAMVGDPTYESYSASGLDVLVEVLSEHYGPEHEVFIYEAARTSGETSTASRVAVAELVSAALRASSTLFIPPKAESASDLSMLIRLARGRS